MYKKPHSVVLQTQEIQETAYRELQHLGLLDPNTLYMVYYDKHTCLLCQKDFNRLDPNENPNFCPECLKRIGANKS